MKPYRYVPVWRRAPEGITLYRCFEILGEGFTVQSKDSFTADSIKESTLLLEAQFFELLLEQAPDARFEPQSTIEAAVESFDTYFRGDTAKATDLSAGG